MNEKEFVTAVSSLEVVISVTGKKYREIDVQRGYVHFKRERKNTSERISITELFSFYSEEGVINTSKAKLHISGRVQSPAVAILKTVKAEPNFKPSTTYKAKVSRKSKPKKLNDENKFFQAFSNIIGEEYFHSKSINKPIRKDHIFLSNNYKEYQFSTKVENAFKEILTNLNSSFTFSSISLSHHVDGLVQSHPILGNRIVEFDEEQHFTPARKNTLEIIKQTSDNQYVNSFLAICNDLNYLNREVLPKNRITSKLDKNPAKFKEFMHWLQSSNESVSGYIRPKTGFEFKGGRIAQRAYYDSLRDLAHHSNKNINLEAPLRFAKKTFEDEAGTTFGSISEKKLKQLIIVILQNLYNINLT